MPFLNPKIRPALAFPGVGKRRVAGRSRGEADPLEICINSSRLRSWIKLRISCIPWRWGTREIVVGWQFQTWTIFSLYPPILFFCNEEMRVQSNSRVSPWSFEPTYDPRCLEHGLKRIVAKFASVSFWSQVHSMF